MKLALAWIILSIFLIGFIFTIGGLCYQAPFISIVIIGAFFVLFSFYWALDIIWDYFE